MSGCSGRMFELCPSPKSTKTSWLKNMSWYESYRMTLIRYQLDNIWYEVRDCFGVYDFRQLINNITKYSHLIKFNCVRGRFNCWTEGSKGETTKSPDMNNILLFLRKLATHHLISAEIWRVKYPEKSLD